MKGEVLSNPAQGEAQYATDAVIGLLFSTAKYRLYKCGEAVVSHDTLLRVGASDYSSALIAYHKDESKEEPYPYVSIELKRFIPKEEITYKRCIKLRHPYSRSSEYHVPVQQLSIIEKIEESNGNSTVNEVRTFMELDEAYQLHDIISSC